MRRATGAIVVLALAAAGCPRKAGHPGEELEVADALLAQARSPAGIGTDLVDAEVVERVRRIQLVRRTALDTREADTLLAALSGEAGPDKQYPEAVRAAKQRERATRGLRAQAQGDCKASLDEAGTRGRLRYLLDPIKGTPDEIQRAQEQLGSSLHEATGARLDCSQGGKVGLLMRRGDDGKLRVVDIWEIGGQPIQFDPNIPGMK
jgi:hypothetical protein